MKSIILDENDVYKAIEKIESTDLITVSIDELEELLKPLFIGYKVNVPNFDKGIYLYRGRICSKPNNIKEVSYPHPTKIKSYGRLNNIGDSIFYGATARSVPFFELDATVGDTLALSVWKSTEKMLLNHIGFTGECSSLLNSNRDLNRIYDFVKKMNNFSNLNNLVHSYLASKFTQKINAGEEYKYKLTIAIGRKLMMGDFFVGILYPTIAMSGNADNIAIKTDFADSKIDFVSVEFVKITEKKGFKYSFDILDSATKFDNKGNILWLGRALQWKLKDQGEEIKMKSEDGAWVGYDKNGNRVDPE